MERGTKLHQRSKRRTDKTTFAAVSVFVQTSYEMPDGKLEQFQVAVGN